MPTVNTLSENVSDRPRFAGTVADVILPTFKKRNNDIIETKGRLSTEDNGHGRYIYKIGSPPVSADNGIFIDVDGASYLELLDKQTIRAEQYGVKADGTDDKAALTAALTGASAYAKEFHFPPDGRCLWDGEIEVDCLRSITIKGNGCVCIPTGTAGVGHLRFSNTSSTAFTLAADVAYKSVDITLTDATGISVGDIIFLQSDQGLDSLWTGYKAIDIRRVVGIEGNVLTMDSGANLEYITATDTITITHYPDATLTIEDLEFDCNSTVGGGGSNALFIAGYRVNTKNLRFDGVNIGTDSGLFITNCVNIFCQNTVAKNLRYGVNLSITRHSVFEDTQYLGGGGAHPISIGSGCSHTYQYRTTAQEVFGLIDAHPSFHNYYHDCSGIGGSMNSRGWGTYIYNVRITDPTPLDRSDLSNSGEPWFGLTAEPDNDPIPSGRFPWLQTDFELIMEDVDFVPAKTVTTLSRYALGILRKLKSIKINRCRISALFNTPTDASQGPVTITNSTLGGYYTTKTQDLTLNNLKFDGDLFFIVSGDAMQLACGTGKINFANVTYQNYDEKTTATVTFDNTDDTLNATDHGFLTNQRVRLSVSSGGFLPVELNSATMYYVVNATANTFQVSTSFGGSAVNFTDDGTGTFTATQQRTVGNAAYFDNFKAVNCDFGTFDDWCGAISGSPTYKFTNCNIVLTNDAYVGFNVERFENCVGTIAGRNLAEADTLEFGLDDSALEGRWCGDGDRDGTGDALDFTLNNNDATWGGTPAYAADPTTESFAFRFDGSSYVTLPAAISTAIDNGPATISFWLKMDSVVGAQCIMSTYLSDKGFILNCINGSLIFYDSTFGVDSQGSQHNVGSISAGIYTQITLVLDSTSYCYINGQVRTPGGIPPTLVAATQVLNIGWQEPLVSQYLTDASVWDFRVYSRAFSSTEISILSAITPNTATVKDPTIYTRGSTLQRDVDIALVDKVLQVVGASGTGMLSIDAAAKIISLVSDNVESSVLVTDNGIELQIRNSIAGKPLALTLPEAPDPSAEVTTTDGKNKIKVRTSDGKLLFYNAFDDAWYAIDMTAL